MTEPPLTQHHVAEWRDASPIPLAVHRHGHELPWFGDTSGDCFQEGNRAGTSKSNMFDNTPNETQYFYSDNDASGEPLEGGRSYAITFAAGQEPPVNGFWSLTLYNEHHFFHPNSLKRYSLGTKNKTLKRNGDGSLTLYAGATSPGADRESNWLPAPDGHFSLYIRAYWGKQGILDGSWQPPGIRAAK